MIRLHRVRLVLAGIVVTLLNVAFTLPASASSPRLLPPPEPGTSPAHPVGPVVRTMVVGGMPGWQIALIAIAASLVAATAAVLVYRTLTIRITAVTERRTAGTVATPQ
jgi:glycerol uptake facilitator-like aquaporin